MSGGGGGWRAGLPRLALLGYLALIFLLSSRPQLDSPVEFPLWDKVAHLVEYGILGWLMTLAYATFAGGRHRWHRASGLLGVLAAGLLVGLLDEGLQSQIAGRDANLGDLAGDLLGVALGWGLARWTRRRRRPARTGERSA